MIRYAEQRDWEKLCQLDHHVSREELANLIALKRVIVLTEGAAFIGWLRFNLFWDNTPFMNLLYLLEDWRGQGYGGQLTSFWEDEMKTLGFDQVLTSSLADERSQFFYRRHGYVDCGSLLLPGEPLEIIFRKEI